MLRIIRTKYLGPTDTKGARIAAVDLRTGTRIVDGYDHGAHDAHSIVADKLATKLKNDGQETRHVAVHCHGSVEEESTHEQFHVYEWL